MIKDLEQLAIKYQKIAEHALHLKRENSVIHAQLESLQQQLALLIDDKLQLEHKNNILTTQLDHIKQNLISVIDDIADKQSEVEGLYTLTHNNISGLGAYSTHGKLSSAAAAAAAAIDEPSQLTINNDNVVIEKNSQTQQELQNFEENQTNQNNVSVDDGFHLLPSVDLSGGINSNES